MDQGVGQKARNVMGRRQVEKKADNEVGAEDVVDLVERYPSPARSDSDPALEEALDGVAYKSEAAEEAAEEDEVDMFGEDVDRFGDVGTKVVNKRQSGSGGRSGHSSGRQAPPGLIRAQKPSAAVFEAAVERCLPILQGRYLRRPDGSRVGDAGRRQQEEHLQKGLPIENHCSAGQTLFFLGRQLPLEEDRPLDEGYQAEAGHNAEADDELLAEEGDGEDDDPPFVAEKAAGENRVELGSFDAPFLGEG